ncbi:glycosyltransferase [Uliginosibacterium sp. TH139]|uniref:glycosyltransferase n=1 Tax=Uliginosibacterium sp. TH139 TaxID=2067453 RepID=UPI00156F461E|nr:glycosyltransferase [Uliginosibacterium sp. TH139]
MRVLMLSDVYFPRINGVSTAIQTYREQLAHCGIETLLIAPRYENEADEAGIQRLPGWRVPLDPEDRFVRPSVFRQAAIEAARDCDLIHIHTPFCAHGAGLAAGRACNLPVVASYHTLFEEYLHHYAPFLPAASLRGLARRVSRQQCNGLDAIVVPSSPLAERLQAYGVARPLHILPTGVPLAHFGRGDGARFRREHNIPSDRPVALYVGRAAHEKNIDFLIESLPHALRSQPELLLVIAGEGPARRALQEKVDKMRLAHAVRFIGYMDRVTALPDCYAAANLFVFASRTETQGLVLIEAMAAGLPVVALAEMGTRDVLAAGSGALTPADNVAAFAATIVQVLEQPELARQMRQLGLEWARGWTDHALTARLAELYRSLRRPRTPHPLLQELAA